MPKKNWIEWVVFGLSTMLVLGVLGYLAYSAATIGDAPPQLAIQLGSPETQGDSYAVPVTIHNTGDTTAENVEVEVVLQRGGEAIEQGQFNIAFIPRDSRGEGWVTFRQDPAGGELRGRVLGYEQP